MGGWGDVLSKIFNWIPGRKESKANELERLLNENAEIQQKHPLSFSDVDRLGRNLDRIKLLRSQISKIE